MRGDAEGEVVLSVHDNGRGFDVALARQTSRGRGLRDLTYVAARQGGTVTITSAIGRGTELTMVVPLERPTLDNDRVALSQLCRLSNTLRP